MTPCIVLVGCGALGSHIVLLARNLPVRWLLIDGDRVESKNTASQFYPRNCVGRNKADALRGLLASLWGMAGRIEVIPRMVDEGNVEAVVCHPAPPALVIDATDNAVARNLLTARCLPRGIPVLHGGLAADGAFGLVWWDDAVKPDDGDGAATCEGGEHLPIIVRTAALMAASVAAFLLDGRRVGWRIWPNGDART